MRNSRAGDHSARATGDVWRTAHREDLFECRSIANHAVFEDPDGLRRVALSRDREAERRQPHTDEDFVAITDFLLRGSHRRTHVEKLSHLHRCMSGISSLEFRLEIRNSRHERCLRLIKCVDARLCYLPIDCRWSAADANRANALAIHRHG